MIEPPRFSLPQVTLCAAASVNVAATVAALSRCQREVKFGAVLLFTDLILAEVPDWLRVVPIDRIESSADYSSFMIRKLGQHIATDHVLIVQWDGFIINPEMWSDAFLAFDYIGAVWPQFPDGANVGNGGFCLRSKRLLDATQDPSFVFRHPEDVCICRDNRALLTAGHGIRFAPPEVAERFSRERGKSTAKPWGFHGMFNLMDAVGPADFADIYASLDDRSTVAHDWLLLARQCLKAIPALGFRRGIYIQARLFQDWLAAARKKHPPRNAD